MRGSRIGSLGFCVTAVVSAGELHAISFPAGWLTPTLVAPVAHCQALQYIIGFFYEVSLPATSLLFFFRVKAVYAHGRVITLFFGALWFAILGLSILPMVAIRSGVYSSPLSLPLPLPLPFIPLDSLPRPLDLDPLTPLADALHRPHTQHATLHRNRRRRLRLGPGNHHRGLRHPRLYRYFGPNGRAHAQRRHLDRAHAQLRVRQRDVQPQQGATQRRADLLLVRSFHYPLSPTPYPPLC